MESLLVLATEGGVPYDDIFTRLSVPLGILVFLGGPYLLLRSNLGTKRAYLVLTTSFFGFMLLISLWWGFGGPGTPALTGPTNLPGTAADAFRPVWIPFAPDSVLAGEGPWAELVADESAFTEGVPDGAIDAVNPTVEQPDPDDPNPEETRRNAAAEAVNAAAVDSVRTFFGAEEETSGYPQRVDQTYEPDGGVRWAQAADGRYVAFMVLAATYQPDIETGELPEGVTEEEVGTPIPEGEEGADRFPAYTYFDPRNPVLPSLLFLGISIVGFLIHAAWLYADEQGERKEREAVRTAQQEERVPAGV